MDMRKKGMMLLFATAIVSGLSIFLNSYAVKGFDSSVFTFSKNIVVAIAILSLMLIVGQFKELKQLKARQWLQLSFIGLIGGSIPFMLFFYGLQVTSGATAGFLQKTLFIFSAALAVVFLKEKPTKWMVIGVTSLLAGTYLMIRPDFAFSIGHVYVLAAVVFWAFENVYAKKVMKQLSGNTVAFGRMLFGSMFILAYLFLADKSKLIFSMSSPQYGWILLTALLLIAYVVTYYNGLKYTDVMTATSLLAVGAPITALLSYAFSGAEISLLTAAGMVLILAGTAAIAWGAQIAIELKKAFRVPHGRA